MDFRLLRHATCLLTYHDMTILIDPVFSEKGALPAIAASPRQRRNPLVDLPISEEETKQIIDRADAVIITHTHKDHFDPRAVELIPKDKLIVCQMVDESTIRGYGFHNLLPVQDSASLLGISIRRIGGHHGKGKIGEKMGPVSGFILSCETEPSVYFAGDTLWCEEVKSALTLWRPDVVVLFAGAAQFLIGGRITMSVCDIRNIALVSPSSSLIAVHMEAYNHCLLSRRSLADYSAKRGLADRLWIPFDGDARTYTV